jgi:hypothetical protein
MHSHPVDLKSNLMLFNHLQLPTEQVDTSGNASDLYSRSAWFESAGILTILTEAFYCFLRPLSQMLGHYLKLGTDCFLPHSFQFIVLYHPVIQHCTAWVQ